MCVAVVFSLVVWAEEGTGASKGSRGRVVAHTPPSPYKLVTVHNTNGTSGRKSDCLAVEKYNNIL